MTYRGRGYPTSRYKKSPGSVAPSAPLLSSTLGCLVLLRPAAAAVGQWRGEEIRKTQVRQWTNPIRSSFAWLSCWDDTVSRSPAQEEPLVGTQGVR